MDEQKAYRERWGFFAHLQSAFFGRLRARLGIRVYGVYSRPLVRPTGSHPALPDFEYRVFEKGEADALIARAKRNELQLSETFVRKALDKGDVCDAVLHHGEIVSFGWSAFSPTHDTEGVYIGFGAKDRYSYFAFTLPEYRGRHLPRLYRPFSDGYHLARGCTHSISFIAVDNRSSIGSSVAAGNRRIGFAGYLKRGRLFIAFRTLGVRRRGFRFFVPAEKSGG